MPPEPTFKHGNLVQALRNIHQHQVRKGQRFRVISTRHIDCEWHVSLAHASSGDQLQQYVPEKLFGFVGATEEPELNPELNNIDYLRDLSDRLGGVPVMHGVDQYDMERLRNIASVLEALND